MPSSPLPDLDSLVSVMAIGSLVVTTLRQHPVLIVFCFVFFWYIAWIALLVLVAYFVIGGIVRRAHRETEARRRPGNFF